MTRPSPKTAPELPTETAGRTVIARPTRIEGKLLGSGEILVDGTIQGAIDSQGKVRIAEHGRIEADVHADTVEVAGTVNGHITADADRCFDIQANGRTWTGRASDHH